MKCVSHDVVHLLYTLKNILLTLDEYLFIFLSICLHTSCLDEKIHIFQVNSKQKTFLFISIYFYKFSTVVKFFDSIFSSKNIRPFNLQHNSCTESYTIRKIMSSQVNPKLWFTFLYYLDGSKTYTFLLKKGWCRKKILFLVNSSLTTFIGKVLAFYIVFFSILS